MNIRIGSDIKLNIHLTENNESVDIKSATARFTNVTKKTELDVKNSKERFPIEPTNDAYSPTSTQINSSGNYTYNENPSNLILEDTQVEYNASVTLFKQSGWITVTLPATSHASLGTYDLDIHADIIDESSEDGVRHVIVSSKNVCTIVEDTEEEDDNTVEISIGGEPEPIVDPEPVEPEPDPVEPEPTDTDPPGTKHVVTMLDGVSEASTYGTTAGSGYFTTNESSGVAGCVLWTKDRFSYGTSMGSAVPYLTVRIPSGVTQPIERLIWITLPFRPGEYAIRKIEFSAMSESGSIVLTDFYDQTASLSSGGFSNFTMYYDKDLTISIVSYDANSSSNVDTKLIISRLVVTIEKLK